MNNRIIIFSTIGLLFASFVFLSFIEQKKQDVNSQDWWVLYFENPKNNSLDFTIENHSDNENFHWEIFTDKTKAKEGNLVIKKGEQKTIPVSATSMENKRITTVVTSADNKKEIYKTIAND
ncbi:MAG: hypothetical protein ACD_67C00245G0002 [uncultured bacterium]|nr:MAG: hypothetical protein ACD_67C00245G0002 [uncultured bacterium]